MFRATLFIANGGSNPSAQRVVTDKAMWYIHTMEYSLAMERKEILTQATRWMNIEYIHTQWIHYAKRNKPVAKNKNKNKECRISLIWGTMKGETHRNRKQNDSCQGLGEGRNRELFTWDGEKALEVICTTMWIYLTLPNWTRKDG